MTASDVRTRLKQGLLSFEEGLQLVDGELASGESAALWVLRGNLIQLSSGGEYSLGNAKASYERAIHLAPELPEAYEELGHFYDAVEPDPQLAVHYYQEALLRGAGDGCRCAVEALLRQNEGGADRGRRTRR